MGKGTEGYAAGIALGVSVLGGMLVLHGFSGEPMWLYAFFVNVGVVAVLGWLAWCAYAVRQIRRISAAEAAAEPRRGGDRP